jgi:hypothetical protein
MANMTLTNTLVDGDCSVGDESSITSGGHNIESPGDTCGLDTNVGDQVKVTPQQLGPLQDNGGPTMTHALLTEPTVSVAIDVIPVEDCVDAEGEPLTTDQRGQPRDSLCDVGAFEWSARDPALATYCAAVLECFPEDENCEADFMNLLWRWSGGDLAACTSAKLELVECAASSDCDKLAEGLTQTIADQCVDQFETVFDACEIPVK